MTADPGPGEDPEGLVCVLSPVPGQVISGVSGERKLVKGSPVQAKSDPPTPALSPVWSECRLCPTEPQAQGETGRERACQAWSRGRGCCRHCSQEDLQGPYLSIRTSSWAPGGHTDREASHKGEASLDSIPVPAARCPSRNRSKARLGHAQPWIHLLLVQEAHTAVFALHARPR